MAKILEETEPIRARAYSQWAAEQLGGAELDALNAWRATPGLQWTDEEFAVIRPLVEDVLRARGYLA